MSGVGSETGQWFGASLLVLALAFNDLKLRIYNRLAQAKSMKYLHTVDTYRKFQPSEEYIYIYLYI